MDPLPTAKDGKLVWTNQPESTQNIVTWALGDRSIVEAYDNGAMPEFKGSTDRAPDEYIKNRFTCCLAANAPDAAEAS